MSTEITLVVLQSHADWFRAVYFPKVAKYPHSKVLELRRPRFSLMLACHHDQPLLAVSRFSLLPRLFSKSQSAQPHIWQKSPSCHEPPSVATINRTHWPKCEGKHVKNSQYTRNIATSLLRTAEIKCHWLVFIPNSSNCAWDNTTWALTLSCTKLPA